jgi:hypothetical protein
VWILSELRKTGEKHFNIFVMTVRLSVSNYVTNFNEIFYDRPAVSFVEPFRFWLLCFILRATYGSWSKSSSMYSVHIFLKFRLNLSHRASVVRVLPRVGFINFNSV